MNGPRGARRAFQSIVAVAAGLTAIVVLSTATDFVMYAAGVFPPSGRPLAEVRWLIPTAYRLCYGVLGCYLAARLAPTRPMRHALVLGGLGFAAGIAGVVVSWNRGPELGPLWYSVAILAIQLPCAWAGGRLHGERGAAPAA